MASFAALKVKQIQQFKNPQTVSNTISFCMLHNCKNTEDLICFLVDIKRLNRLQHLTMKYEVTVNDDAKSICKLSSATSSSAAKQPICPSTHAPERKLVGRKTIISHNINTPVGWSEKTPVTSLGCEVKAFKQAHSFIKASGPKAPFQIKRVCCTPQWQWVP